MILISIALAFFYWVIESLIHSFLLEGGTLLSHILSRDPDEIWMRLLVVFFLILNGILAQMIMTKRQQMEKVLFERKRMDLILSSVRTGFLLINQDMTIAWANDYLREMFFKDEPIGQICHVFFQSRENPCDSCGTIRAFSTGEMQEFESFNPDYGRWYHVVSQPIKDGSGTVVSVLESMTDITNRKRFEEEAQRSIQELKESFELQEEGVVVTDLEGRFIQVNSAICNMLGYSEEELLHMTFKDITHPDDLQIDLSYVRRMLSGEINSFVMEKRYLHKGGDVLWILLNASIIRDSDGNPGYFIGQIQNITDRRRASVIDYTGRKKTDHEENALTELDQIFNTIPTGMCLIDTDFNLLRVNRAFLNMFDLREEDVKGLKCDGIWEDPLCRTDGCPLRRILSGENFFEYEIERKVDDKSLTCIVTSVPFRSPEGEIRGIIKSYTDITDVRQLEKEVINISEIERQNIGQELHDELGQRLAGISFRIEALKEIMEEKSYPETPDMREISTLIQETNDQVRNLIRGIYPVKVEHNALQFAIEELAAETERVYGVSCHVERKGRSSINDFTKITHLYYIAKESVNNAIKHSKAGNIMISLTVDEDSFDMSIKNDGVSINEENADGRGLGLKIMQYRAKIIGARLDMKMEEGWFSVRVYRNIS